jgi:hypothetical protein
VHADQFQLATRQPELQFIAAALIDFIGEIAQTLGNVHLQRWRQNVMHAVHARAISSCSAVVVMLGPQRGYETALLVASGTVIVAER